MLNSHLWGGLFWHVDPPYFGFPRSGLFQKKRQPLASPGFQELHSFLPWLSLPPHWIQLPTGGHGTSEQNIRLTYANLVPTLCDTTWLCWMTNHHYSLLCISCSSELGLGGLSWEYLFKKGREPTLHIAINQCSHANIIMVVENTQTFGYWLLMSETHRDDCCK